MPDAADLYPPSPPDVPPDLTAPSPGYRARVVVVLLCLTVFLGVYLTLTVGSAYACYACFAELAADEPAPPPPLPPVTGPRTYRTSTPGTPPPRRRKPVLWLFVGGVGSGLLFLFMVKGLFKQSRPDSGVRVEVTEAEQPELFAFIRRLCQETKAPFPHRVFLVPDVNAAVAYHESVLNLFFPARKNLIIGLGLVNRLTLSEFKAVLAHEFGHFSQKSMKLGSYVYTANRVVADVVYRRDWLDDFLATLRGTDIRIAVFAWAFSGVLWVMRKGLELLFRGINFAHTALSRQMEYNADLVAVSVAGSDAIVSSLARLDFAAESLGQAWADLSAAADHGHFTRDLYFHHTRAAEFLKTKRNDPTLGEVPAPAGGAATVFRPEDATVPKMWATHPTNYDREVNAKRRYVRGPEDPRPAWELFRDPAGVREAVTRRVYESAGRAVPEKPADPEAVQAFINAEHAETTYNPRYHGLYDDRYVRPGELNELLCRPTWEEYEDPARLAAAHARLFGPGVKDRMEAHRTRQQEANRLAGLTRGAVELTGRDFEHRGKRYPPADAARLLKEVEKELEQDFTWMHLVDRESFRVHYAMARQLGAAERDELEQRYRFHLALQDLHATLVAHSRHVQATLAGLSGRRQVSAGEFQNALAAVRGAHDALAAQLQAAEGLRLPPLTNMTPGAPLGPYLLDKPLVRNLHTETQTLDGAWVGKLLEQTGEVLDKAARVLFKSLGGLLALQERIAERWVATAAPPTADA